jgi:hypothetical protein
MTNKIHLICTLLPFIIKNQGCTQIFVIATMYQTTSLLCWSRTFGYYLTKKTVQVWIFFFTLYSLASHHEMLLSLHRFGVLKLKVVAFTMARSKLNSRINLKNSCYSHLLKEKTCCFLIINLSKKILFSTLEWLFHVVFLSKKWLSWYNFP